MKRVGIILQARMGSQRLPGKVMKTLVGKPMIQWAVETLKEVQGSHELILATTTRAEDNPLAAWGKEFGVPVFRGDDLDVLDRYYQCARKYRLDVIVRATGDNPFVDREEAEGLIDFFLSKELDYANAFPDFGSGLPVGIGVEVFSFAALEKAWKEGKAPHHREHVNEYFQENPQIFTQATKPGSPKKTAADLRMTVDTPEDFRRAEKFLWGFLSAKAQVPLVDWIVSGENQEVLSS